MEFATKHVTSTPSAFPSNTPSATPSVSMPPTTTFESGLWVPNTFVGEGDADVCILDNDGDLDLPAATPKFASKEDCCA
eukprot:scaffold166918_cov83-Cyclotella_meneghiniana.AAC.1